MGLMHRPCYGNGNGMKELFGVFLVLPLRLNAETEDFVCPNGD